MEYVCGGKILKGFWMCKYLFNKGINIDKFV